MGLEQIHDEGSSEEEEMKEGERRQRNLKQLRNENSLYPSFGKLGVFGA